MVTVGQSPPLVRKCPKKMIFCNSGPRRPKTCFFHLSNILFEKYFFYIFWPLFGHFLVQQKIWATTFLAPVQFTTKNMVILAQNSNVLGKNSRVFPLAVGTRRKPLNKFSLRILRIILEEKLGKNEKNVLQLFWRDFSYINLLRKGLQSVLK